MPRLSIIFKRRAAERLEELASDGRSKADVLREALALEQIYRDGTEAIIVRT